MKHKTWFRLVIKAIGVLLIGLSLREMSMLAFWVVVWLFDESQTSLRGMSPQYSFANVAYALPDLAVFAFGMYLFFGGAWIVNKCIPSNKPYCAECGYDLSQSTGERCAECGTVITKSA